MKLEKDLREFFELLNSHNVEFVIVGGHAVAFHGYPRYTGDVDIFVRATADNAQKVVDAVREFGFPADQSLVESLCLPDKIIQMGQPPNRIDLLTTITAVDFDEAFRTAVPALVEGVPVRFIDRELLLRNKRATGRAKDFADVDELEQRE